MQRTLPWQTMIPATTTNDFIETLIKNLLLQLNIYRCYPIIPAAAINPDSSYL